LPSYEEYRQLFLDIQSSEASLFLRDFSWPQGKLDEALSISNNFLPSGIGLRWEEVLRQIIQGRSHA